MLGRITTIAPRAATRFATPRVTTPALSAVRAQQQQPIIRPQARGYHEKDKYSSLSLFI